MFPSMSDKQKRTPEKLKKKALINATGNQGMVPTRSSSPGFTSNVLSVAPTMVASSASALAASAQAASLRGARDAGARPRDEAGAATLPAGRFKTSLSFT